MITEEEIREKIANYERLMENYADEDTQVGCHRLIAQLLWVLEDVGSDSRK